MSTLEAKRRPLTATERRLLQAKARSLSKRGRRTATIYVPIGAAVIFALWLATIAVSDAPWTIITLFWIVVGGVIGLWVRRDMRKDAGHLEGMAERLRSALKRNEADAYDVRARSFAEFEEIEDEGACYAFELEDGRLVFISGQEFYAGAKFPSLDFALVYILDEQSRPVDMLIEKRSPRAAPARTIPGATKQKLELPDHLEMISGRIETLEAVLRQAAASRS